jgi:hypothetical protein
MPSSTSITNNTCSGGTSSGSLTGTPSNGEMSLSGTASLISSSTGSCTFLMVWKGSGSGTLTSASYSSTFVITPSNNVVATGYSLTILINGVAQPPVTCSQTIAAVVPDEAIHWLPVP